MFGGRLFVGNVSDGVLFSVLRVVG